MKILCVCDQGNNRAVHFSSILKYEGHETIPIGLATTSAETLEMLFQWADLILCTDTTQVIPPPYQTKYRLYNVGQDRYPRPFNRQLYLKVKKLLQQKPIQKGGKNVGI